MSKTYDQWLSWIESCHVTEIDLGLDRCRQVLHQLLNEKLNCTILTVAGTNGKGSTVAVLEALALQANKSVVVYTSPHILNYRERLRFNGSWLTEQLHVDLFEAIDKARDNISLTYFEFATLSAFKSAEILKPDLLILETGLGGRLDAVNVVEADLAIITTVDYDHQEWLGNDLVGIAREKAGIIHGNTTAIIADPDFPAEIIQEIKTTTDDVYISGEHFNHHDQKNSWTWKNNDLGDWEFEHLTFPNSNASAAIHAWYKLYKNFQLSEDFIRKALSNLQLDCRFETLLQKPSVILDVAHNPQAFRVQLALLNRQACKGNTYFVLGMLEDKNTIDCINEIKSVVDQWFLTDLDATRGNTAHNLKQHLMDTGVHKDKLTCYKSPEKAFKASRDKASRDDRIIVTGSFYTVAPILALIQASKSTD
ncbi:MAG: bifunctional folylpolyglutamate synthase/dihydrofolate synthase [Gammaproteobacteria bacterium]|nr:MAG: bifunctional folylpolyglutamate synthase/dihydrofolate synthase [Gammaproteobacteria bacterium]